MIRSFNRRQRLKATGSVVTGVLAYLIAWFFFRYVVAQGLRMSGVDASPWLAPSVTAAVLCVITISGWRQHRSGREPDMSDAVLWKEGVESFGAAEMQLRVNQVTSSAWVLASLFTAGPVGLLKAFDLWTSCLPADEDLERRMSLLLRDLKSRGQWVSADSFRDHWEPLSALIRTGHVEFSSIKGRVRASS